MSISQQHIDYLEKWCDKKIDRIIYDSDVDGENKDIFKERIAGRKDLYFLNIKGDLIYGGFTYKEPTFDGLQNGDEDCFIFTFNENGQKQHYNKYPSHKRCVQDCGICLPSDNFYFFYWAFGIVKLNSGNWCHDGLDNYHFEGSFPHCLIGDIQNPFSVDRVIVIQMK